MDTSGSASKISKDSTEESKVKATNQVELLVPTSESELENHFIKYDSTKKGFLTPEEYAPFGKQLVSTFRHGIEMNNLFEEKLKKNGKITIDDVIFVKEMITMIEPEENIGAPATKIIKLLKNLQQVSDISEEDKKTIDWGISVILSGEVYQTELGSPDSEQIRSSNKELEMRPESKKNRMIPWMQNFASPKIDPKTIEAYNKVSNIEIDSSHKKGRKSTFSGDPAQIADLLHNLLNREKNIDCLEFNIFECEKELGRKKLLPLIAREVLQKHNAFEYIDEEAFENFIEVIRNGYIAANPYHNDIHAADVVQMAHYMLDHGVIQTAKLSALDVIAVLIACIIHDYRHPGLNNMYLQNTKNDLALLYNDQSVLENYHASEGCRVIWKDDACNIFKRQTPEEKKIIRKMISHCILGTDNAKHFDHLGTLNSTISAQEISNGKNAEKIINTTSSVTEFASKKTILGIIVHAADISNSTREFGVSSEWSKRVTEEFYKQGDKEKLDGIPISMFCNRDTGNLPASQIGFISGIIRPYFEKIVEIFPKLRPLLDNINKADQTWSKIAKGELKA